MAHEPTNGKDDPALGPMLRRAPEDFEVEEIPLESPAGDGPHTLVQVRKRDRTTEGVARDLAQAAEVPAAEVGFAGRKDRWAVTTQWFSVPHLEPRQALELEIEGAEVLAAELHRRKIRPGDLRENRFRLVLHRVDGALAEQAEQRLEEYERGGFPNRFGAQRFGRYGDNAERGAALLRGERTRLDRRAARFLVSALQSAVFNRVLDLRAIGVDALRTGDVVVRHSSETFVRVGGEESRGEELRSAMESFEISPTGPLFGPKMWLARGETLAEEEQAMTELDLPTFAELRVPRWLKLPGARRSLRARLRGASFTRIGDHSVGLEFALDPGCYATIVVEELFAGSEVEDGAYSGRSHAL